MDTLKSFIKPSILVFASLALVILLYGIFFVSVSRIPILVFGRQLKVIDTGLSDLTRGQFFQREFPQKLEFTGHEYRLVFDIDGKEFWPTMTVSLLPVATLKQLNFSINGDVCLKPYLAIDNIPTEYEASYFETVSFVPSCNLSFKKDQLFTLEIDLFEQQEFIETQIFKYSVEYNGWTISPKF